MKTKEQILEMAVEVVKATKGKKNTSQTLRAVFEEMIKLTK